MSLLHFDVDDLSANRSGRLSEIQKKEFLKDLGFYKKSKVFTAFSPFFVLIVFVLMELKYNRGVSLILVDMIYCMAIASGIIWILLKLFSVLIEGIEKELQNDNVEAIQGIAQLFRTKLDRSINYHHYIKIGDKRWHLSKKEYKRFKDGEIYTLYYASHTDKLLSFETLQI